jgi:lipid-binding SYLF domain-containing protein
VTVLILCSPAHANKFTNTIDVYKKSKVVQPFFKKAYGYEVFPTIGKAGIGIEGLYGKGQIYKGGKVTGEVSVIKGSTGFQLGAQAFSEMIFSEDKRAYDEFASGNFEFDTTASAVAITAIGGQKFTFKPKK